MEVKSKFLAFTLIFATHIAKADSIYKLVEVLKAHTPEPFEVESFAQDRGISEEIAQERLQYQARATALNLVAADQLGSAFGGVWIDVKDDDRLKVGVMTAVPAVSGLASGDSSLIDLIDELEYERILVKTTEESVHVTLNSEFEIRDVALNVIESLQLTSVTDIVKVNRSLTELKKANSWIANQLVMDPELKNIIVGIRTDLNAIELQTQRGRPILPKTQAFIDKVRSVLGDGLIVSTYEGPTQALACNYPYCDPPLRGGNRITNNNRGCTNAFVAQSKIDSKMYQFTAGHCVTSPFDDSWATLFSDNSFHLIGGRHNSIFGNSGDMAILLINNVPGWDPENWVHVTSGPDTTADTEYEITKEGVSVIGMRICTTGGYYGRSDCGTVTQLGVTVNYGGQTVSDLGRSSFCVIPGDSGAPIYASHTAYGLVVARTTGSEECDTFYQGINRAEKLMNVNIIH